MVGRPHSEKTDEKLERIENHKKMTRAKCFSWRDGGFHLFSLSTRKVRSDLLTVCKCFPRQKILGSHHFAQLAEKRQQQDPVAESWSQPNSIRN